MPSKIQLHRKYRFSASHLYRRPEWSEEQNRRHFGKCANLPGHGHNYRLWVRVEGEPDAETGFIMSLTELDESVTRLVLDVIDHQHLNAVIPEFAHAIPSSENLVLWILERLRGALPASARLVGLRVEEDDDLAADWSA